MNTKTFAQQARTLLMDGVSRKLIYWGFSPKGEILEQPDAVSGGYTFRGDAFDDDNVPELWQSLKKAVQKKGIEVVVEEAAYTWFNRLMAIRILAKNGYDLPQLDFADGLNNTPILLQKARQGQYDFLNAAEKTRLQRIIGDYNKENDAFALLLVGYCHSHNTLNKVFGKLDDYTELLLPDNMLQDQGFLSLLNTTDAISDDEYKEVELIGWLYQFYISERKKEVFTSFNNNKKAEAKDIPAATQIFTPNWIVKYMVENTAGKIWLDHKPDSPIKDQMKYLVINENNDGHAEPVEARAAKSLIADVEELTLIDPACGSGHILVEGFDLLYKMYQEEYYTPEEAIQTIFSKNLYGLDIDDRAAQLSTFAVLLKAAQVYPDVWSKDWQLNIYPMPEANAFSTQEITYFLGEDGKDYIEEVEKALQLMQQAKNLGSVMQLNLSEESIEFIIERYEYLQTQEHLTFELQTIKPKLEQYIPILITLSRKFTAVVANPPYLYQTNMNSGLKKYLSKYYPISKADLFAVFMESTLSMTLQLGFMGMINQHSWMFLSSYEKLREMIIGNYSIQSMLHLGPRSFEELSGEVVQSTAFILKNSNKIDKGTYYRLVDYRNVHEKEKNFIIQNNKFSGIPQTYFNQIPGRPIAYWANKTYQRIFSVSKNLEEISNPRQGMKTLNNKKFIHFWSEVSFKKLNLTARSLSDTNNSIFKWYPINHGGAYRKWYGNNLEVVNWQNDGKEIKTLAKRKYNSVTRTVTNLASYLQHGISWGTIASGSASFRTFPKGFFFSNSGQSLIQTNINDQNYLVALLNSRVSKSILDILTPGMGFESGYLKKIPVINVKDFSFKRVEEVISIAKKDWDSREISWDFEQSPLLNNCNSFAKAYQKWDEEVTQDFFELQSNEEELNRIFIDIYGLQDELTPEVALKNITILQDELSGKDLEALEPQFREQGATAVELPINKAVVMQQFISYAIGIFMGRYRLDKPGLNIAHPNPTQEELASYSYNNGHVIIDEDAIVPLMGTRANFKDDALYQIQELLDTIWGKETRTENLNFLQDGLNKDLEKYLLKDFWKDHCKVYKKKPIYWLFSSKKGAFQVLVYMHRMNAFTVEKIRANYLLEHLKHLNTSIAALEKEEANLTTQQGRRLDQLRKDLRECEEYDMLLKDAADNQIVFDLDNGVTENYKLFDGVVEKIK
ncbi:BREX-1 system adenine-specific DNA-methyltransferase PglX [Dokdonia sp. Dokd-P16]|uniref:BREX-1 system adenine-specific DNA-methyltransferase PglX n=1 Tax=Dokdonia sp. Dokd-P16 TaxID=2173169 RepID=UPI000D54951B|nr:BREX-1 system adenine-specific DNA-methyltransferase PglX [Dokdonia sp. Dokd-P16]AWH75511.1 BREX-1 system adenine-specific DNA-methyltransferase PglX [Dokdonia sp. Dokd-P16]